MKGTVIEFMKKMMFRRIGAMAVAFMLALSLMVTPAMAASETKTVDTSTITINNVIPDVRYDAYQLLRLVDYDKELTATDKDGNKAIGWYKYEIPAATDPDNTIRPKLMQLIGDGGEFKAGRDANGNVNKAGFEVKGDDVMFWVPATTTTAGEGSSATTTTDDAETSRGKWDAASQEAYMTRFAEALRKLVDGATGLEPTATQTVTKPEGGSYPNSVTFTGLEQGYWFVTSSAGTRSMVFTNPGTNGSAASITEKNKAPSLTKTVHDEDSGRFADKNDANIGDIITYRVEIDAPAGSENLSLVDTLTEGLTFVELTEVTFYPRGTDDTVKNELGKPARKAFHNSEATGELSDHISLIPVDEATKLPIPIDLTGDVTTGDHDVSHKLNITVRDSDADAETRDDKLTQQLKIKFDEVFLKSLRSSTENPNDYTERPMEPDDVKDLTDDAANAAYYNVFLGDMNTMEDDGGTIVVEYTAKLNEKAVLMTGPQKNNAKLTYGHNPDSPYDKGPDGETPNKETETYTYDLNLYKFAAGDENNGLAGAQFSIGRKLLSIVGTGFDKKTGTVYGDYLAGSPATVKVAGNDVKYGDLEKKTVEDGLVYVINITDQVVTADAIANGQAKEGDRVYRVAMYDEKTSKYEEGSTTTIESGDSGRITVKGLDSNMYVVYEDKAPDGFSALDKPVFVTIGSQAATVTRTEGDNTVTESAGIGGQLFVEDVKAAEGEGATRVFMASATVENGSSVADNTLKIANNSGIVMPTTGGIGTTIFYVVGIALVLGAGVLLVVKKRVGSEEK